MLGKTFHILALACLWVTATAAVEEYMPMHPGAVAETGYGVTVAPLRRTTSADPSREPSPAPRLRKNMVTLTLPSRGQKSESRLRIVEAVPGEDGAIDFSSARTVPQPNLAEIPGMIDPEVLALEQYNLSKPAPLSLPQPIASPLPPGEDVAALLADMPATRQASGGKTAPDLLDDEPFLREAPRLAMNAVVLPELSPARPAARAVATVAPQDEPPPAAKAEALDPVPAKPLLLPAESAASAGIRPPDTGATASLKPPDALAAPARPLAPPADGFVSDLSPPPGLTPMMPVRDGNTVGLSSLGLGLMPPPVFAAYEEEDAYFGPPAPPPARAGDHPPMRSRRPTPAKSEPPRITMPEPDEYGLTPMREVKHIFGPALRK